MQTQRGFVVGTDFSECAEQALALALELAASSGARVTLVHVCELGIDGRDEQRLFSCDQTLAAVVARHRHGRVELTRVLRSGTPWLKLDNVAAEVGASLIVIGRHGAGRGRGVELGSIACGLLRHASRPVLAVACDFDRLEHEASDTHRPNRKHKTS